MILKKKIERNGDLGLCFGCPSKENAREELGGRWGSGFHKIKGKRKIKIRYFREVKGR